MTTNYPAKCNACGHEFIDSTGHGFYFTIYKCENCGQPKRINHPGQRAYSVILTTEQIGHCEKCEGKLSENAKSRCPKCQSDNLRLDKENTYSID